MAFSLLLQVLCLLGALAAAPALAETSACNQAAPQAITGVDVPGHPFVAVSSADGCTVFVSLTGARGRSQLAVLKRLNGSMNVAHTMDVPGQLTGLALTRDGSLLVGANGQGAVLFSVDRLVAGADNALLGVLNEGVGAGSIYVVFSPDERLLFMSNERSNTLSVYDFAAARTGHPIRLIGHIPTGIAPVGLAVSPDGRWLYSTSEVAPGPSLCPAEGRGGTHAQGLLMVVDVQRSATDPVNAVAARAQAGCNPVRVVTSPQGERVYVSARGSNLLQVFDSDKLLGDPAHALIASAAVGQSPVGIAASGDHVFVANSDRFGSGRHASVSVLDVQRLDVPGPSIPAGGFPRELRITSDGQSLLVTHFESQRVDWVDLARLAEAEAAH